MASRGYGSPYRESSVPGSRGPASFPGWRGHRPRVGARTDEGGGKATRSWRRGERSPRGDASAGRAESDQVAGPARRRPRPGPTCRWGARRAQGSTWAASVCAEARRPDSLRPREGQREGPPPVPAVRRCRSCRRETGGTIPEQRNQFGRSRGAEGGHRRARGRGAGKGEEPLASRESLRSRRQLDELPGPPGQPPCAMKR